MTKNNLKGALLLFTGTILGMLVCMSTTYVLAHGGDTSKLHACVDDTTGAVRMVGENDTCPSGEHNVDWDKEGYFGLPFFCNECQLGEFADKFAGKDFSHAQIRRSGFMNADLTGTDFSYGDFYKTNFVESNLTGVNFSNSNFWQSGLNLSNFTNADFSNATNFYSISITESNLSNTNFTNVPFARVDMTGATNAATATFTGATWDDVTCPDGTNSNENSNTCVGHLTP